MSHHHRIIVPTVTDRPTGAGEWLWTYPLQKWIQYCGHTVTFYAFKNNQAWMRVLVTETPAAGRLCRELQMGGSALCGLTPWSGQWRKAA